jgi:hypothetical protein
VAILRDPPRTPREAFIYICSQRIQRAAKIRNGFPVSELDQIFRMIASGQIINNSPDPVFQAVFVKIDQ